MLSQTAEYALRAVVFLANHEQSCFTVDKIAEATKVPAGYLAKILQNLARTGLVRSQRGLHGGFRLDRDPTALTLFDVLQAVDPIQRIDSCPLHINSHSSELCPLHRELDAALGELERRFRASTIASLLREPNANKPLCSERNSEA